MAQAGAKGLRNNSFGEKQQDARLFRKVNYSAVGVVKINVGKNVYRSMYRSMIPETSDQMYACVHTPAIQIQSFAHLHTSKCCLYVSKFFIVWSTTLELNGNKMVRFSMYCQRNRKMKR